MGILDILQGNDAGQSNALLQLLQGNAAFQQPQPGGLPSDLAQYAAPMSLGGPVPGGAPAVPAAQPPAPNAAPVAAPQAANAPAMPSQPSLAARAPMSMAGPTPAPAAPQAAPSPGVGDRLMAGLQSLNAPQSGGLLGRLTSGISGLVTGERADPSGVSSNATAKALAAKGVDPATIAAAAGNPEMMHQLIAQYYGAPKAPTALGSGYIWNAQTGKVERAYEPDDKVPVGFQKTANGLQPIPGGPADPSYLRAKAAGETDPNAVKVLGKGGELYKTGPDGNPVIVHKNEEGADATLSDGTVKAMASQYLAGDRTVLQNLGRGAQGAANIVKIREEIAAQAKAAGLDGKGIVDNFNEQAGALAGQRTVGTRAANISLAANEAKNMIDVAVKASEAVPRSQYVPWNKAVQAIQTGSSSPQLASFVAATNSLVNAYVRAVSPSGVPTDSMREHAYSMLNSAQSHEAYMAVIGTMKQEMDAAIKAPGQVQKELRRGDKPAEGDGAPPAPAAGSYAWTPGKGLSPK